jgi:hypothetical protein
MSDDLTIQCDNCGTIFSDLEEVCPYCGQPRPALEEIESLYTSPDEEAGLPPNTAEAPLYEDEYTGYPDEGLLEEDYLSLEEMEYPADPLADDDIFAVAENELPAEYPADDEPYVDSYDEYGEPVLLDEAYDESFEEEFEAEEEDEVEPRRFTKRRLVLGCLGVFLCGLVFYGGIGLLGAYHGLQERYLVTQAEAESHYQKGQEHLANDSLDLAIAEFELALSLNPNLLAAREALRNAQQAAQAQPTPTSETRSAAAESILVEAEGHLAEEDWGAAVEKLTQVRDLDPDYQPEQVSDLIFTANYQLGLQLLGPDQMEQAVLALEAALSERPDDPEVKVELAKALLYLDGTTAADNEAAVEALSQLYRDDAGYFDVKQRLFRAHEAWGDDLINQQEWCQAQAQFIEAALIQPSAGLDTKTELSARRCQEGGVTSAQTVGPTPSPQTRATRTGSSSTPAAGAAAATSAITSTLTPAAPDSVGGKIYYSAFNPNESRWEILAVPAQGGSPQVIVTEATMPAVSPNGRLLLYRSEADEEAGFYVFDLTSGQEQRITILRQDVLPRWGGDSNRYLFVAQEPATGRWQIQLGFADGKSDPIILRDGRTPDWSSDGSLIAYQGTDPQGNDPGIYLVPFEGGEPIRLTNHESDRMPVFSPNGSQIAFMSTRNGDWDVYTVSTSGSAPRQITTGSGNDGLPAWSPDGSRLAYVSDTGGSWGIYTISAGGGTPTRVSDWDGLNRADWLEAQIWWGR